MKVNFKEDNLYTDSVEAESVERSQSRGGSIEELVVYEDARKIINEDIKEYEISWSFFKFIKDSKTDYSLISLRVGRSLRSFGWGAGGG